MIELNQKRKKKRKNEPYKSGRDSHRQRRSNKNDQFDGQLVRWRGKIMVARFGTEPALVFRRLKTLEHCCDLGF